MKKSTNLKTLMLSIIAIAFIHIKLMATVVPGTVTLTSISPAPTGANVLICDGQQLVVTFTYSGNVACTG